MVNDTNNLARLNGIQLAEQAVRNARHGAEVSKELEQITPSMAVLFDRVQDAIKGADLLELKEKYNGMKSLFFAGIKSRHTLDAYARALNRLETWSTGNGLELLALTPQQADAFILSDVMQNGRTGKRAPASIRRDVAGISSFYGYMVRATAGKLINPFIKSLAIPSRTATKQRTVPTDAELEAILESLPPSRIKGAVLMMAKRGLRVGALNTLEIRQRDGVYFFTARTKGKEQNGRLSGALIEELKRCGLSVKKPFSNISTNTLQKQIERELTALASRGIIPGRTVAHSSSWKDATGTRHSTERPVSVSVFSCHSFRHYYAVKMYRALGNDIETLRKLLNHQSITVTQSYLTSLGVVTGSDASECL